MQRALLNDCRKSNSLLSSSSSAINPNVAPDYPMHSRPHPHSSTTLPQVTLYIYFHLHLPLTPLSTHLVSLLVSGLARKWLFLCVVLNKLFFFFPRACQTDFVCVFTALLFSLRLREHFQNARGFLVCVFFFFFGGGGGGGVFFF